MKRALICALVFALVVLGAAPFSVCSLFSSMNGQCEAVAAQAHCNKMDMAATPAESMAAQAASCCAVSQAPAVPQRIETARFSAQPELGVALAPTGKLIPFDGVRRAAALQYFSPPPLHSLLCIFLI